MKNNSMNYVQDMDLIWMNYAILLADHAKFLGEVAIGAVLVLNGLLISYGWNTSILDHDPCGHAEIVALRIGGKVLKNYRLLGTTLYVTLEPCLMCIGAIIHSRISRLVYGVKSNNNKKIIILSNKIYYMINHRMLLTSGVLKQKCLIQLKSFFKNKRNKFRK